MTYYNDVYKKRAKWWGDTSKDQYTSIAKKYFSDFLLRSPNAEDITLNNSSIRAAVLSQREEGNQDEKIFLIDHEEVAAPGSLIGWYGAVWIVMRVEKRSFESYNKITALMTNYTLKWTGRDGRVHNIPAYLQGAMTTRLEDNYRLASGQYVIPLPNKNLRVIIPSSPVQSEDRFIIKGEAWRVLDRDLVSIDGLMYLYLQEDLVNPGKDDVANEIAFQQRTKAKNLEIGMDTLSLGIGESFTFSPVLYEQGIPLSSSFVLVIDGEEVVSHNLTVQGAKEGATRAIVRSVEYPEIEASCQIMITEEAQEPRLEMKIVGADTIKWGVRRTYNLLEGGQPKNCYYIVDPPTGLVSVIDAELNTITIEANKDNKVGEITLYAITNARTVEKKISVVSLWG